MLFPKYALIGFIIISFVSCSESEYTNDTVNSEVAEEVEIPDTETYLSHETKERISKQFLKSLEEREQLAHYFQDNWYFMYNKDDSCEGSTEGEVGGLDTNSIDFIILVPVHNNGKARLCENSEPSDYEMEFDLDRELDKWDHFEIVEYEDQHPEVTIIYGAGDSVFIKLNFNQDGLISTLEYTIRDSRGF